MDKYQAKHPELETTYIGTADGAFINAPHNIMPKTYDPRQRPWYQEAVKNPGRIIITAPYVSVSSGQEVVTIAEQTADRQAVIAEDLELKTIQSIINNITIGHAGYVVLLDSDKDVIAFRGQKPGAKATGSEIDGLYKSTNGTLDYTMDGTPAQMVFTTNRLTDWKIAGTYSDSESTEAANPILRTTITVLIIALLLGLLLMFIVVRSILKPMQILVRSAQQISKGDLTVPVHIKNSDEIGDLGRNFEAMRQSLQSILYDVRDTSHQVASSAEELMASSGQGAQATQVIAETIEQVAIGSEQQVQSVENGNQIIEEMSQGIQQIAERAQSVSATASSASDAVGTGRHSIEAVVEHMQLIRSSVTDLANSVQKLDERSQQISTIVEAITHISSQTNLLALNAAIEAARAGEHGKGFSVVAGEIRKLAEQSSSSAQAITDLIHAIQTDTDNASTVALSATESVEEGITAVTEADTSFNTIRDFVTHVADQIHEVSAAVQQMAASSDEVAQAIGQVTEIAESTASGTQSVSAATEEQLASMEEISASATELAKVADELQHLIERFRLSPDDTH